MGVVETARFRNGQMRFITDFNQFSAERDDQAHERLLFAAKRLPDRRSIPRDGQPSMHLSRPSEC